MQVTFSNNQERKAGEIAASTVEINCLAKLRSRKPSATIAKRTSGIQKEVEEISEHSMRDNNRVLTRLTLVLRYSFTSLGQEKTERGGIQS